MKGCLPLLTECGFDVAEAVTPAPVGDIEIEQLRRMAGDSIVIWGGLPGSLFTPQFTDTEFDAYVRRILDAFRHDNKFVLGVGDQVPPDAIIERIKRVSHIIDENGGHS